MIRKGDALIFISAETKTPVLCEAIRKFQDKNRRDFWTVRTADGAYIDILAYNLKEVHS